MYLIFNLILLLFYCIGLIALIKNKKQIFFSSLFALPQAFYGLILVPVYWNPKTTSFLGIGLEDFIFSFLTGGLVWLSVLFLYKNMIYSSFKWNKIILKFTFCVLFGFIGLSILYFLKIRDIVNPFLVMILWSALILILHFEFRKIALSGAFSFLLIYILCLKTILIIRPEFISFWTLNNLSNVMIFKMPVEELIWAFLYGLSWSLGVAYILDVQIKTILKPDLIPSVKQ